jgi:NAD(P)H-flavin reductase
MTVATPVGQVNSLSPWLPKLAIIDDIRPETPGVATYRLRVAKAGPDEYAFTAGQFNMLYLPGFGEAAISMSGPPPSAKANPSLAGFVHTIRQAGQVTSGLARLQVGDTLALRGPYGKPWPIRELRGRDVILMAGGIGLAPLRPVIYELLARRSEFGELALLMGARTAEGLLYRHEYSAWAAMGLEIHLTVDRADGGWSGNVGVVPLLLDRLKLPRPNQTSVLTCGPEVMMRYAALGAVARGVASEQIWVSLERHMQCAIGLCGHCQLGTELLCRDGPVYPWHRVQALLQVPDL